MLTVCRFSLMSHIAFYVHILLVKLLKLNSRVPTCTHEVLSVYKPLMHQETNCHQCPISPLTTYTACKTYTTTIIKSLRTQPIRTGCGQGFLPWREGAWSRTTWGDPSSRTPAGPVTSGPVMPAGNHCAFWFHFSGSPGLSLCSPRLS